MDQPSFQFQQNCKEVFDQIINSKMMAEYDQSTLSKGVGTSLEAFAAEYTPSKKHGTG